MRVDKIKKLSSVSTEIAKNPLSTVREIAEETWVSKSTVANYINEDLDKLGQKDKNIIIITDTDRRIIEKSQIIIEQAIDKHIEKSEASGWLSLQEALQVSWLAKESTARYTIFRWTATDEQWGLKQPTAINIISPE